MQLSRFTAIVAPIFLFDEESYEAAIFRKKNSPKNGLVGSCLDHLSFAFIELLQITHCLLCYHPAH